MEATVNHAEFFALVSDRPAVELDRIQSAYSFAETVHRNERRDSGEPYFEHPRAVAVSLVQHGFGGTEYVVDGLLHDVVESPNVSHAVLSVLTDLFGQQTWEDLMALSQRITLFHPITGQIVKHYKKPVEQYFAELGNARVKTVKCGDRLHNLQTCGVWEAERRLRYLALTEQYVLPIARELHLTYEKELADMIASLRA